MATPTMNRKNGKIRSVGVQPCQSACLSGPYMWCHEPGLFTMSIAAMVMPRKMSSDASRCGFVGSDGRAGAISMSGDATGAGREAAAAAAAEGEVASVRLIGNGSCGANGDEAGLYRNLRATLLRRARLLPSRLLDSRLGRSLALPSLARVQKKERPTRRRPFLFHTAS